MASTYSSNLRLELIGTGDQQGTWGITTNTNLGTLLEEAIGGYVSVTVSDSGDTTLTVANGATDQSRNMVINLTGTISAARTVICPAIEKLYVVRNATTGGFAVTFKVSGQTGVSIPNGSTYFVYVNGTDVQLVNGTIASQNANNVSITGGSISGAALSNVTVVANASSLSVRDADGSHTLSIAAGSNLTANRVLTLTTGDAARTLDISSGNVTISTAGANLIDDASASAQRTTLGVGTGDSPEFLAVNIGNASDTTLARVSAGVAAIGGKNVALNGTSETLTTGTVELGNASDTTLSRAAAGVLAVESNRVPSPASQAHGDILYRGATDWERLAAGTSGQFLKTQGSGSAPAWETLSTNSMTLLGTITTTSGTTQSLTGLDLTSYKKLILVWIGVRASSSSSFVNLNDGTSDYRIFDTGESISSSDVINGEVHINLENGATIAWGKFDVPSDYGMRDFENSDLQLGRTRYTTASTSVTATCTNSGSFDAGSIKVYGVK